MKIKNFGKITKVITCKKLNLIVLCLFSFLNYAQENISQDSSLQMEASPVIVLQANDFTSLETYLNNASMMNRRGSLLKKLYYDKNDAIYLNQNSTNVYGTYPVCLYANANTFSRIITDTFNREQITLINIKINNVSELGNINFSDVTDYPSLTYVVFTCTVPVTAANFSAINLGDLPNVEFIYHYQNPS